MKKALVITIIFITTSISAQMYQVVHPKKINKKEFHSCKIFFKNDSIASGYGTFFQTGFYGIRFTDSIPEKEYIKNFKLISMMDFEKVEMVKNSKKTVFHSIKTKGVFKKYILLKVYESNLMTLYRNPLYTEIFGFHKKNEEKAKMLGFMFKNKTKKMPSRILRVFNDCPQIKKNYKKKIYKNNYESLIQIINDYDKCKSN
ncbi:hypothetical protein H3Z83_05560 [Tenacibaculum sp. S7007]|uniref:Uncharacterized protein n=1 Tax=Tenacibaculum pelagium TaxID=2759527 RepID=A0A839ALL7_9FLAO|nr:hypothetical protein [Tenacibaculum pelagium]MBA6155985.1 hypothetical protein [Tenacibaculum pelagium]